MAEERVNVRLPIKESTRGHFTAYLLVAQRPSQGAARERRGDSASDLPSAVSFSRLLRAACGRLIGHHPLYAEVIRRFNDNHLGFRKRGFPSEGLANRRDRCYLKCPDACI